MLRVVLFGAGRIGQVHARSVAMHDEARLAWVIDPVLPAAEELADRYGATAGTVVDDALGDPCVDAVVIASPTPTHIGLLQRAVLAGKPVLCDGHGEMAATGDAHQAMVLLRSRQGALCSITNSRTCVFGHDQRIEAFGDGGMLEAANQTPVSVRAYTPAAAESAVTYQHFFVERYREAYLAEFSEFVRTVREGRRPAPGFADGRAALALAEAAIESAATGRAVAVPGTSTTSAVAGDQPAAS
jgi:predicted dehydrogenase